MSANPSGNPSPNPSGNPHFEPRATPAPTTTPTTEPAYARDHGTGLRGEKAATAAIREIPPLDAIAATICLIRPEWRHGLVRATLARTNGSWRELAIRGLRIALDADVVTPLGLENADRRRYEQADMAPRPEDHRAYLKAIDKADCGHGDLAEKCALCRRHLPALEAE